MDQNQQAADGQNNTDTAAAQGNDQAQGTQDNQQQQAPAGDQGDQGAGDQGAQGDGQAQGDGDGKGDGEDGKQGEPVNYEFKVPDGYEFDAAIAEKLTTFAREKNLTAEEAQKLVDLGVEMRQQEAQAFQTAQQQWVEQIKADPEMGGAQLGENVAVAKKALDAFGTPELKGLLDSTGFGNHPEVVRAFYKIGKAISEDRLVVGEGKPRVGSKDPAKTLFPNQN